MSNEINKSKGPGVYIPPPLFYVLIFIAAVRIQKIIPITDNKLVMTNFLLSDTTAGDFPCERYNSIDENIKLFEVKQDTMTLARLRNVVGKAVQLPKSNDKGRQIGTLYSTFLNITDMQFVLVYKLDDTKLIKLDLTSEFENKKKRKIDLK